MPKATPCWTEILNTLQTTGARHPTQAPEYNGVLTLSPWVRPVDRRCSLIRVVPFVAAHVLAIADDELRDGDTPEFLFGIMARGFASVSRQPRYRLCRNLPEPFFIRRPDVR